jgi:hypothetical protein
MAVLWMNNLKQWMPLPLNGQAMAFTADAVQQTVETPGDADAQIVPAMNSAQWALLARSGITASVNGEALYLGIRVLRDRDAIRIAAGNQIFFSTESLAQVVAFPENRPIPCARCKTEIAPQSPAVKCPQCGAWHHQTDVFPCWTYAAHCAACERMTEMNDQYHWTPDGI